MGFMIRPGRPTAPLLGVLNPTPQPQIDEMWPGGRARGVITAARHEMASGTRALRTKVWVRVRGRLPGGGYSDEAAVTAWVHWRVAVLLEPGLEVPVEVDPSSARVTGLQTRKLADELAPRAHEADRRHRAGELAWHTEQLRDAGAFPGVVTPSTPSQRGRADPSPASDGPLTLDPIEGVTLEHVAQVHAMLGTIRDGADAVEEVAVACGIPPGRWEAVDLAWRQRILRSRETERRFVSAIERARRDVS